MELKAIKDLFLKFLNKFENEKDLFKFFNYLQLLLIDFETDFSKFKEKLLKELNFSNLTTKHKNWIDFFDDTIFEKEGDTIIETEEPSVDSTDVETTNYFKTENQKHVVDYLIKKFNQNPKPYRKEIHKIASKTKCTYQQIIKWFSDKRFRKNRDRYFPEKTIKFLLEEFEKQRYPSPDMIQIFANKLNLTYKQVLRWFNRRRYNNGFTKLNDEKEINKHSVELICDESNNVTKETGQGKHFPPETTNFLLKEFKKQRYPSSDKTKEFADKLDLSYLQVRSWFQYYRRKYKYFQETIVENKSILDSSKVENKSILDSSKGLNSKNMKNIVPDRYFPIEIRNYLIQEYEKQRYPSTDMVQMFANKLNLTFKQVMKWFCERRYKNGHTNVILNDKKVKKEPSFGLSQVKSDKLKNQMVKKTTYYHPPFSIKIRNFLIQEYEKQQNPITDVIQVFANKLNLTFKQVKSWFETRRSRLGHSKKHNV